MIDKETLDTWERENCPLGYGKCQERIAALIAEVRELEMASGDLFGAREHVRRLDDELKRWQKSQEYWRKLAGEAIRAAGAKSEQLERLDALERLDGK